MAKSIVEGILFSDSDLPGDDLQQVVISISRQNALPSDLKKKMAKKVREMGGNAVSNFEVAQSGHHWLFTASILMWDSESLHGVGQAKLIPKDLMKEALGK
jgi:hypothetical protein